jgi:hypothetical protein
VVVVQKLGAYFEADLDQQRHVFALELVTALPDRWTHTVHGAGEDEGLVFEYYWLPLTPTLKLAGGQERLLHLTGGPAADLITGEVCLNIRGIAGVA